VIDLGVTTMNMPNSCQVLEAAGHNQALQTCAYCDPVWNAIQAEALAESENDSALSHWLEESVLKHRQLEESLGYILGERLFPSEPMMLQQELLVEVQRKSMSGTSKPPVAVGQLPSFVSTPSPTIH
jgi:hypothetical protein